MLRRTLLALSASDRVRAAVTGVPWSRRVVRRFVAGVDVEDAVRAAAGLVDAGLRVSLDHLGEDTHDRAQAKGNAQAYLALLDRLAGAGLTPAAEVSVKLSALGLALPGDGERIALDHAAEVCRAAAAAGTTVTLDMEAYPTVDATLSVLRELRRDFPDVGGVLQAYLRRTEADCRELAGPGSRIRLCKGAYAAPATVAYRRPAEVDRSFVRCLKVLLAGSGYPMVATHDPRLLDIAAALAVRAGRAQGGYEFQLLYGVRPEAQRELAAAGETVRVYVPYGQEWYPYLMRRLAERPANLGFFLRALLARR